VVLGDTYMEGKTYYKIIPVRRTLYKFIEARVAAKKKCSGRKERRTGKMLGRVS